jgi:hypothetical protein
MALPKATPPTEIVKLPSGGKVTIRGLTRGEALRLSKLADKAKTGPGDLEVAVIAAGTDTDPDEARKWYADAPSADVQVLVDAVTRLSGMDGERGKGPRGG